MSCVNVALYLWFVCSLRYDVYRCISKVNFNIRVAYRCHPSLESRLRREKLRYCMYIHNTYVGMHGEKKEHEVPVPLKCVLLQVLQLTIRSSHQYIL